MQKDSMIEIVIDKETGESINKNDELKEILGLISEMNVQDLEPLIDEDANINLKNKKYHVLAKLRDIFQNYRLSGDTKLMVEIGSCLDKNCGLNCPIINMKGNVSNKNFAFKINKEEGVIKDIHSCFLFIDNNGSHVPTDGDLMMISLNNSIDMPNYEGIKRMCLQLQKVQYEKHKKNNSEV